MTPTPTCPYKDLFGKPGTGVHRWRFLGVAVADVLATVVLAIIVAAAFRWSFLWTLIGLFLLGELLHLWLCVDTAFIRWVKGI